MKTKTSCVWYVGKRISIWTRPDGQCGRTATAEVNGKPYCVLHLAKAQAAAG